MGCLDQASGRYWRPLLFLAIFVWVLTGCASVFPKFQPDRCQRGDRHRDTLNWDLICIQSP